MTCTSIWSLIPAELHMAPEGTLRAPACVQFVHLQAGLAALQLLIGLS